VLSNQRSIYKRARYSQFGLQLWLDATAIDNITRDGSNKISLVEDRTSYLRHFNQPTSANQPTLVLSGINSLPAIRFDGISQFLNFSDPTLSWLNNTSFTFFYVATKTAQSANSFVIGGSATGTRTNLSSGYLSSNTYRIVFGSDDLPTIVPVRPAGTPELYCVKYSTADNSRIVRRNKSVVGIGASNGALSGMTGQALGRHLGAFGQFDLGEVIIYNRVLSDYETEQVERDLMSKWTIT